MKLEISYLNYYKTQFSCDWLVGQYCNNLIVFIAMLCLGLIVLINISKEVKVHC